MTDFKAAVLRDRAVLRLSGKDRTSFLQGLVTADVAGLATGAAVWAALLTPQGKILFDFLVLEQGDGYLLDCAAGQREELVKRLAFYKLRAAVGIEALAGKMVVALAAGASLDSPTAIVFADPRISEMGNRAIISDDYGSTDDGDGGAAAYRARRIALGIPDTIEDIGSGALFPHEADLDQLGGVSFSKGCYVGQEVVSRMEHRGTTRSRILPVAGDMPLMAGSSISAGGRTLGRLLSTTDRRGLALIRLDRLADALAAGEPIKAGEVAVTVEKPGWARFAVPGAAAA